MNSNSEPKPSLADQELRELIKQAQSGDLAAKEKVLLSALPMARGLAKKYAGNGVPFEDLYQEACYGLLVAMNHYDTSRLATFNTYATSYIKKYINNALLQQNSNLPGCYNRDFYYEIKKFMNGITRFKQEKGYTPTDSELSEYLNVSIWRIKRLKTASQSFMAPGKDFESIMNDHCASDTAHSFEDEIFEFIFKEDLSRILEPLEQEVFNRRFDLRQHSKPQTWAYISADLGLSVPTIHFAYRRAVSKIRKYLENSG